MVTFASQKVMNLLTMTYRHLPAILLLLLTGVQTAFGQGATLSGRVVSDDAEEPIEFASILLSESGLWAITDEQGRKCVRKVVKE